MLTGTIEGWEEEVISNDSKKNYEITDQLLDRTLKVYH